MKAISEIQKKAINQAILENISDYQEDYPVNETAGGLYPTEDCCQMIAQYICNNFSNDPQLDKLDSDEYTKVCIDAFYKHLNLSDGDYDETNDTLEYLSSEIKRFIKEY